MKTITKEITATVLTLEDFETFLREEGIYAQYIHNLYTVSESTGGKQRRLLWKV